VSLIDVQDLTKTFKVRQRSAGMGTAAALRRLLRPDWELREAVSHVSFTLDEGEIVGYLGPNGAGKSTTIKCLCGILVPTSGMVRVAGLDPFRQRVALAGRLGAVFGQKTTLWWDVPVVETYQLLREIYEVPRPRYEETLALLTETLGLDEFLHLPVRQLSLGQRVRADLGAAFLHRPRLLLLDEPTIGLDVAVKARLRQFVKQMRDLTGVTVLLTTHDLRDIELLCDRLIIIDHGRLLFEGSIDETIARYAPDSTILVELAAPANGPLSVPGAREVARDDPGGLKLRVRFRRSELPVTEVTAYLMRDYPVRDFRIQEPQIEDILRELYEQRTSVP
jgi:ABC-2 type transport system ATP-binding protein